MLPTKFRNIDGYENMSRKQLESILSTLHFPKPAPKPIKFTPKRPIPAPRTKKPTPKNLYQLRTPKKQILTTKKD